MFNDIRVSQRELCKYNGSTFIWTHLRMYVPITQYYDERIIMVTQLLRQV